MDLQQGDDESAWELSGSRGRRWRGEAEAWRGLLERRRGLPRVPVREVPCTWAP